MANKPLIILGISTWIIWLIEVFWHRNPLGWKSFTLAIICAIIALILRRKDGGKEAQ